MGLLQDHPEVSIEQCSLTAVQARSTSIAVTLTRNTCLFYLLSHWFMAICPVRGTAVPYGDKPCGPVSLGFTAPWFRILKGQTVPLGEASATLHHGPSAKCPLFTVALLPGSFEARTYLSLIHAYIHYCSSQPGGKSPNGSRNTVLGVSHSAQLHGQLQSLLGIVACVLLKFSSVEHCLLRVQQII